MASHQVVAVKGSLYRKKLLLLHLQGQGVSLVEPLTMKESWSWSFLEDSLCLAPSATDPDDIIITVKSKASAMKRVIGMTGDIESRWVISCTNRSKLLSEALFMRDAVLGESHDPSVHMALYGKVWDGQPRLQVQLLIRPYSFSISKGDGEVLEDIALFAIQKLRRLGDTPGGFALKYMFQWHIFTCDERDSVINTIKGNCLKIGSNLDLGCSVSFTELEQEAISLDRTRLCALDSCPVQKLPSPKAAVGQTAWRKASPEPLVLLLTGKEILECQADTMRVNVCRALSSLVSVQRSLHELQRFCLVFDDGSAHIYETANRDVLLVALESILYDARFHSSGTRVMPSEVMAHSRMVPYSASPEFVIFAESVVLKRLASLVDSGLLIGGDDHDLLNPYVVQAAMDFCSNNSDIAVNGTLDSKDFEMAVSCVVKQLGGISSLYTGDNTDLVVLLNALCFLLQNKMGFVAFLKIFSDFLDTFSGFVKFLMMSLSSNHKEIQICTLTTLIIICSPPQTEAQDFKNRSDLQRSLKSVMVSKNLCYHLKSIAYLHSLDAKSGSACILMETLKLFHCLLCNPGNLTTSEEIIQILKELLADNSMMISLLSHKSRPISSITWSLFEQIVCSSDDSFVTSMSQSALEDGEGALLRQFHTALFHPDQEQRIVSAKMVAVWIEGNKETVALIRRILPRGMVSLAPQMEDAEVQVRGRTLVKQEETKFKQAGPGDQISKAGSHPHDLSDSVQISHPACYQLSQGESRETLYVLRQRKREEWQDFIAMLRQDKNGILYCWNDKSRKQLRDCIEAQLEHLSQWNGLAGKRDGRSALCWNYREFFVEYPCLDELICVEGFFLKEALKVAENGDEKKVMDQVDDPATFFQSLYRKMLETSEDEERKICLGVMTMLCRHKSEQLSTLWSDRAFYGVQHLVHMLMQTCSRGVRDAILTCFDELFSFRTNCDEFIACDGVSAMIKLAACVQVERHSGNQVIKTDKMIEAGKETSYKQQEYRFWYCSELEEGRACLLSEIQELLRAQKIKPGSFFRLKGQDQWKPLSEIPQLYLTVGLRGKGMNNVDVSVTVLRLIYKLCKTFPSFNENGLPFLPIPRIKRILWSKSCLSHIVQLTLCGHEKVVDETINLLLEMLNSGDTISLRKLYKTGLFYFLLAYQRSNVYGISSVLKKTHMDQDFYRRDSPMDNSFSASRSILHDLLPESLICFLQRHPPDKFSEMFLGDTNNPEAIWHNNMRRHLIDEISRHISDFTCLLRENVLTEYDYTPLLSPIQYAELQEEVWCHNFYLQNLCNIDLFPDWPIYEPFEVLRSIIERWTEQNAQGSTSSTMTSELAFKKLGLQKTDDMQQIRAVYKKLAVQLHPDKNPNGRAEFEEIQSAYEYLSKAYLESNSHGGSSLRSKEIHLLLRAQSILYRRCGTSLSVYRYPCYQSLCQLIERERLRDNFELLCAAFELIALSISVDRGNAQEYVLSGGYPLLKEGLVRWLSDLQRSTKRGDLRLRASAFICQALSAIVDNEEVESRLFHSDLNSQARDSLFLYIHHSLELDQSPALITASLYFCLNASKFKDIVKELLARGSFWSFLAILFTFEVGAGLAKEYLEQNLETSQYTKMPPFLLDEHIASIQNWHGVLTLWMLSKWSNILEEDGSLSPSSLSLRQDLNSCLTPSLGSRVIFLCDEIEMEASKMGFHHNQSLQYAAQKAIDILVIISTRSESPSCLWNMQMRTRLQSYITSKRGEYLHSCGQDLIYENLLNELYISGTYLRLLAQGACDDVANRHKLCHCILRFIHKHLQRNDDVEKLLQHAGEHVSLMLADSWKDLAGSVSENDFYGRVSVQYPYSQQHFDEDLVLGLEAVRAIVVHEHQLHCNAPENQNLFPPCAAQCLRWLPLLLFVASVSCKACNSISRIVVDISRIYKLHFARSLQSPGLMDFFMKVARTCDGFLKSIISGVQELLSDGDFLEEFRVRGGVIDLLAFSLLGDQHALSQGLDTLCCAMRESLHGQKICKDVSRWFPPALARSLLSSPADCIMLLHSTSRSAEFIWNKTCMDELTESVRRVHSDLIKADHVLEQGEQWKMEFSEYEGLIIVGDIFIDVFVKDPMAKLPNPTGFLDALVNAILIMIEQDVQEIEFFDEKGMFTKFRRSDRQVLDRIAEALFTFVRIRSSLTSHLSKSGSIQRIHRCIETFTVQGARSEQILLQVLRIAADSSECVEAMISSQGIKAIFDFVRDRKDSRLIPALDILRACLVHEDTSISRHLIDLGALKVLLDLLEEGPAGIQDYAVARVHAIEMIKRFETDPWRGEVIRNILESYPVWRSCKDQRHDLFIPTQSYSMLQITASNDSNFSTDEVDRSVL